MIMKRQEDSMKSMLPTALTAEELFTLMEVTVDKIESTTDAEMKAMLAITVRDIYLRNKHTVDLYVNDLDKQRDNDSNVSWVAWTMQKMNMIESMNKEILGQYYKPGEHD